MKDENETQEPPPHKCVADECQVEVPHHLLMCPYHWRQVPRSLQRDVDRTWAMGRGAGSKEHINACKAAAKAVNAPEARPTRKETP
jgi:hypothetical protein